MTHEIWISKILNFDFLKNEKRFWSKNIFLVSQLVSFRLKNQTDKNVADINSKIKHLGVPSPSDNFLSEFSLNAGMLHNPSCLDILKIFPLYNREFKLLDSWVSQYLAFLPKVEESIKGTPANQFIDCLVVPTFIVLSLVGIFENIIIVYMHAPTKNYLKFGGGSKLLHAWVCQ